MHIEVDQSGKIERLSMDTIIACSNSRQYCVMIPKKVKQKIYTGYRGEIKQLRYKLFCVGIYFYIRGFSDCSLVVIDDEYLGRNKLIKSILLNYIKKENPAFESCFVKFGNIGKESNAHHLAIETFRGEHKPNEILTENQIMGVLK